jgi:NADPH-dependent glutamate synthase beta subunit-like oxidoreductase
LEETLKEFIYHKPQTIEEVNQTLKQYKGKGKILAGGTDLLGQIKDEILPAYPECVISIKDISGLEYIKENGGILRIGALTKLQDIADDTKVKKDYTALAEAASLAASPHIREMGTIAGNLCQSPRCWYYWFPKNRFNCIRKGGKICNALMGENRYHSIFGPVRIDLTPCSTACPSNVNIPDYMSKIRDNDIAGAAGILMENNPFPAITGRVCPHFCEQECNRNEFEGSVSIKAVERFIGDFVLDNADKFIKAAEADTGKSVAVIGAGPAGLSAAYYLRKMGHIVTVYDRMQEPGGMLRYCIPPYRLPKDIVRKYVKAMEKEGVVFKCGVNIGKDIDLDKIRHSYDSIFLGCGAWKQGNLNLPNEDLLLSGLDFLNGVMQGKKEIGRKVVVVGGGNVAIDAATVSARLGAREVTAVSLESRDEMPAFEAEIKTAVELGVKLMPSWGSNKIMASKGKIIGIELIKCISVFDKDGRFAPVYDETVKKTVEADQIILAIGQKADMDFLGAKPSVGVASNLITVDDTQATNVAGVFAGGDITTGPASVIGAIAAGRKAANAIDLYLKEGKEAKANQKALRANELLKFDSACLGRMEREKENKLAAEERKKSIDLEDFSTLQKSAVKMEADRCFNCGCVAVSPSDIAPALIALEAKVKTTRRVIEAEKLFAAGVEKTTVLNDDEIILEFQIPKPDANTKSKFMKFALRKSIDFPVVNCASQLEILEGLVSKARICLNAVYAVPYRAITAEESIVGKPVNELNAEAAADKAIEAICTLSENRYKAQIARTLVKRTILFSNNKKY